jgi:hypothetical protein
VCLLYWYKSTNTDAARLQVNPSIKDMERKMTSLANTIYGLVLIVTAGTADVKVVTSLMLTMVMLLKAMNEEMMFLKQVLILLALLVQKYKY